MSAAAGVVMVLFSLPALAVSLGALAVSAWSFRRAVRAGLTRAHTAITEPVSPDEVDGGHAVVTGSVEPAGETFAAPFSGSDAVAYHYRIEQQTDDVGWWTVADSGTATTFELQGTTGRVQVDPGEEDLDLPFETVEEVPANGELPADVRERLHESDEFDLDAMPQYLASDVSERRRYEEGVLHPGDEVYVYGNVSPSDIGIRRIDADDSRAFALATEPISELDDDLGKGLGTYLVLGLFALAFAVAFGGGGLLLFLGGIGGLL